jgi:hypothetical protein
VSMAGQEKRGNAGEAEERDVVNPGPAVPLEVSPELTPGALAVAKRRVLPSGCVIEFESAPAGWLKLDGTARVVDYRAYYLTRQPECIVCEATGRVPSEKRPGNTIKCKACDGTGNTKRRSVPAVSTLCDAILAKGGLAPWSEMAGIHGAVEAVRRGLIGPDTTDADAVSIVRGGRLGADAERDRAADRGINVHALLEEYMLTGRAPNPANHPEPHRPFIRGLTVALLKLDPEPVAVELIVADPDRGYAGRLDLLARIDGKLTLLDLKTQERGGIYDSAHLQTRLYWEAERRHGEHEIEAAMVVVVDGAGGFDEMPLRADADLAQSGLDFYARIKPVRSECDSRNYAIRQALRAAA